MHESIEAIHVASFLVVDREFIVAEWERRVLADDAIPIARTLKLCGDSATSCPRSSIRSRTTFAAKPRASGHVELIRLHAALRRDAGYSLDETFTELAHLRDVLRLRADPRQLPSNRVVGNALAQAFAAVGEVFGGDSESGATRG